MKQFTQPTVEIIHLEIADILTTSANDLVYWEIREDTVIQTP